MITVTSILVGDALEVHEASVSKESIRSGRQGQKQSTASKKDKRPGLNLEFRSPNPRIQPHNHLGSATLLNHACNPPKPQSQKANRNFKTPIFERQVGGMMRLAWWNQRVPSASAMMTVF